MVASILILIWADHISVSVAVAAVVVVVIALGPYRNGSAAVGRATAAARASGLFKPVRPHLIFAVACFGMRLVPDAM